MFVHFSCCNFWPLQATQGNYKRHSGSFVYYGVVHIEPPLFVKTESVQPLPISLVPLHRPTGDRLSIQRLKFLETFLFDTTSTTQYISLR